MLVINLDFWFEVTFSEKFIYHEISKNLKCRSHRKNRVDFTILPLRSFSFVCHHIMHFKPCPFIWVFCTNNPKPQMCSYHFFTSPPSPNG